MRIAFFGTPACAVPYLEQLAAEHQVVAVVSQPLRRQGRGRTAQAPPVASCAEGLGLPLLQPPSLRRARLCDREPFKAAEVSVVVAYGQVLPADLCSTKNRPAVNVHYSLLPELRGPAPVQRAVLRGSDQTGVTIQYVAERLDTGDILAQEEVPLGPQDNAGTVFDRLTSVGVALLTATLQALARGASAGEPQRERYASYAPRILPPERALRWCDRGRDIVRRVLAFAPQPGAYCRAGGHLLKVLEAQACPGSALGLSPGQVLGVTERGLVVRAGEGAVVLSEVQPAGGRRMPAAEYARGARLQAGHSLSDG